MARINRDGELTTPQVSTPHSHPGPYMSCAQSNLTENYIRSGDAFTGRRTAESSVADSEVPRLFKIFPALRALHEARKSMPSSKLTSDKRPASNWESYTPVQHQRASVIPASAFVDPKTSPRAGLNGHSYFGRPLTPYPQPSPGETFENSSTPSLIHPSDEGYDDSPLNSLPSSPSRVSSPQGSYAYLPNHNFVPLWTTIGSTGPANSADRTVIYRTPAYLFTPPGLPDVDKAREEAARARLDYKANLPCLPDCLCCDVDEFHMPVQEVSGLLQEVEDHISEIGSSSGSESGDSVLQTEY
ncbi:hypothetical protein VKT23_009818 [Stygiomarasmius scandens]|uniref:Uncharacterized protein n=1 Tax=Marasmiellus scandens TaxID=2682957 RepID=A0ABR1IR52_9AGAR